MMSFPLHLVVLLACLLCSSRAQVQYHVAATQLYRDLLGNASDYNRMVQPTEHVSVTFFYILSGLKSMDIGAQIMTMKGSLALSWYDPRLTWDMAKYNNLSYIKVDHNAVWTPPITISNRATSNGIIESDIPVTLSQGGYVSLTLELTSQTECDVSTKHYPFDKQWCPIYFGMYGNTNEMTFSLPQHTIVQPAFVENGEWDIVEKKQEKVTAHWEEFEYSTSGVVIFFVLARKKPYYLTAIIIPVLLMSVLIVTVFWVPVESGEKMGYCLTILLTYTLFLSIVSDELPPIATDISYLQVYLAVSMAMGVVATLLTLFVLHLYHNGDGEPPGWLQNLTNGFLLPITCQKKCGCNCCCCKGKDEDQLGNGKVGVTMVAQSNMTHGFPLHVEEEKMTYQDVAKAFDRFFFLVFAILMIALTVAFAVLILDTDDKKPSFFFESFIS